MTDACITLVLNGSIARRLSAVAVGLLCGSLLWSCGATDEQRAFAQKAILKVPECKDIGDKPFRRSNRVLVWDIDGKSLHRAQDLIDSSLRYGRGTGPVTVFVVGARRSQQVGTYSVSGQPAYREWVDVCVVEFLDSADAGNVTSMHEVVSLDPRQSRPVQQSPEHGDPAPPIADWIRSLAGRSVAAFTSAVRGRVSDVPRRDGKT